MARTSSKMTDLGTEAEHFSLPDGHGTVWSISQVRGERGLLVAFICNHCPFVKLIREGLAEFARDYQARGLGVVAINANDITTHPEDSPEQMTIEAADAGYTFPYLYDQSQEVAKAYGATCTPDFFLYDASLTLVYRGQFDDSRPGNGKAVTGSSLRTAADALLAGMEIAQDQTPSVGCNIKWRPGNEPSYAP